MPKEPINSEFAVDRSAAAQAAWRLLHIEPDDVDALKLKLILRDELPSGSTIDHTSDWEEGSELLHERAYDAVLLGLADTDARCMNLLRQFVDDFDEMPVIVLSNDHDERAAVAAGRNGASAYLLKSKLTSQLIFGALRQALQHEDYEGELPERRKEPRYPLETAAILIPIEADGRPGKEIVGGALNISLHGLIVMAEQDSELVPDICLVGLECPDGVYRYATVEWRHRRLALPAIRFGGRFLRRSEDPLHPSRLTPRFDPREFRYMTSLDAAVLKEWVARGILRPRRVDRVLSCPKCEALPTFRKGCPQCGSANTEKGQLIHHFACAHVAPASEFAADSLICPKCQVQNLVVGADFEYLQGPISCRDCSWCEGELEVIAECLRCGHRFLADDAVEKEVFEYHVDRLDPMALIDRA